MKGTPHLKIGHQRWFRINCSLMLYRWDGKNWLFTGQAVRRSKK